MEYTNSTMPKWRESAMLLKASVTDTKHQAERIFLLYNRLRRDFGLRDKQILEVGAGGRAGLLRLFDDSNEVTGIDKYLGYFDEGWYKWLKSTVRSTFFDPVFYSHLRKLNGGVLHRRPVVRMDAECTDYPDANFDFIYSRYLMEHIVRVDRIAQEIHRCLKPGGVTYHVFTLYTSIDGAHALDWRRFQPWQHLYGSVPSNAFVNKLRLHQYRDAFEQAFGKGNVELRLPRSSEAERLLTPEVKAKLPDYDTDELVGDSPEIIAYKRA